MIDAIRIVGSVDTGDTIIFHVLQTSVKDVSNLPKGLTAEIDENKITITAHQPMKKFDYLFIISGYGR